LCNGSLHNYDSKQSPAKVFLRLLNGAPGSFFLDIRAFRPNCSEAELLEAVRASVARRVDILNMSLGRMVPLLEGEEHLQNCKVCKLTNDLAVEQDILVIAAVGNWADQAIACPSLAENVLAIGATLTDKEIAFYRERPEQQIRDFDEGRSSTSFACAMASAGYAIFRSAFPAISANAWVRFVRANRAVSRNSLDMNDPADFSPICVEYAVGLQTSRTGRNFGRRVFLIAAS
jgi:hypothetical protein